MVQIGLTLTASLRNTSHRTSQKCEGSGNAFTTAKVKEKIPPDDTKWVLVAGAKWGISGLTVRGAQKTADKSSHDVCLVLVVFLLH